MGALVAGGAQPEVDVIAGFLTPQRAEREIVGDAFLELAHVMARQDVVEFGLAEHHELQQLRHVELVRKRVNYVMARALAQIRGYLSLTDGNTHIVDRLHDQTESMAILARVTDFTMTQLGDNSTAVDEADPSVRRSVKRAMPAARGRAAAAAPERSQ